MHGRRSPGVVATLALVVCAGGVVATSPQRLPADATFGDVLTDYMRGDAARAVRTLAAWDEARLAREAVVPADAEGHQLSAGVAMLLTDAGMANGRFGETKPRTHGFISQWGLDRFFETQAYRASEIVESLAKSAKTSGDASLSSWTKHWYILAVSHCVEFRLRCTNGLLEMASHLHGDDPDIMLLRGSVREPRIVTREYFRHRTTSVGFGQESRFLFRQALDKAPLLAEARMRLGRSLHVLQNDPDAPAVLEHSLEDALATRHVFAAYLAALTLGEIHEERGRLSEAIPYYRQAVDVYPAGYVAATALGLSLVRTGQREDGWAQGRRVFGAVRPGEDTPIDPMSVYWSAQYWQSASRARELRNSVRGGRP